MLEPLRDRVVVSPEPVLPAGPGDVVWRRLGADEIDALHRFVLGMERIDRPEAPTGRGELESLLRSGGLDVEVDTAVAEDDTGIVAVGLVALSPNRTEFVAVRVRGGVDPRARGRGIGRVLLAWQVQRAMQRLALLDDRLEASIGVSGETGIRPAEHLFGRAGFAPQRTFLRMRRRLGTPVAPMAFPRGLRATAFAPDYDESLRVTKNAVFVDHWRSQPESRESWAKLHLGPHLARDLSRLALAADGSIAGFVVTWFDPEQLEPPADAYVELVGVTAEFRGTGVARALLADVLGRCAEAGLQSVTLDVDGASPTGADRLYASVGFSTVSSNTVWMIAV